MAQQQGASVHPVSSLTSSEAMPLCDETMQATGALACRHGAASVRAVCARVCVCVEDARGSMFAVWVPECLEVQACGLVGVRDVDTQALECTGVLVRGRASCARGACGTDRCCVITKSKSRTHARHQGEPVRFLAKQMH
eukprot:9479118-Pyramimonas_sp.AAC.2